MSRYTIDIVLSGKNQLKAMMSSTSSEIKKGAQDAANANKEIGKSAETAAKEYNKIGTSASNSMNKAKNASNNATSSIISGTSKAATTSSSAFSKISSSASSAFSKVKNVVNNASSSIISGASKASSVTSQAFSKISTTASNVFSKVKASASNAFSSISKGASTAASKMDGLSSAVTGLLGSYSLLQVAQDAWTGATQAEFNTAYLKTKMSDAAAQSYIKTIQNIVAAVPGDDTFMNQILTGALARQTNLSTTELSSLGHSVADYMSVSASMGKSQIETQMDLKEYITTGNTAQMERDSILKNQLGTLQNQATVSDRIKAINTALVAEGYAGLSALDLASIKWETMLGLFQKALTSLGGAALTFISPLLSAFLKLDEVTGGFSTTWMTMIGIVGLAGVAIIGLLPQIVEIGAALTALTGEATALGAIGSLAFGPIGIAILAITATIAAAIVIWQLWGTQITAVYNKFKAGDWAGAAGDIKNSLVWAGQQIYVFFASLPGKIGSAGTFLVGMGNKLAHWILQGLTSISISLDDILNGMFSSSSGGSGATGAGKKTADYFGKGFVEWIKANGPTYVNTFITVVYKIIPLMGKVALKIGTILMIKLGQALQGIGTWIWSSITKINFGDIGSKILSKLGDAILAGASNFVNIGSKVINWLIQGLTSISMNLDTILNGLLDGGSGGSSGGSGGKKAGEKAGKNTGQGFIDKFTNWVITNGPKIQAAIVKIFTKLLPLLGKVALQLGEIIMMMLIQAVMQKAGQLGESLKNTIKQALLNAINSALGMFGLNVDGNGNFTIVIPSFQWPSVGQILNFIVSWLRRQIPRLNWKIPTAGQILGWIYRQIGRVIWHIPGIGQIASLIFSRIPRLQWPSVGQIYGAIVHALGVRGPPAGESMGNFRSYMSEQRAKLAATIKSKSNTPTKLLGKTTTLSSTSSTAKSNMGVLGTNWKLSLFSGPSGSSVGDMITGMFHPKYLDYSGHRKDPLDALLTGGNCVDLSLGYNIMAGNLGASTGIGFGTWDGGMHMYSIINGQRYDPARKALQNISTPPARGPGGTNGNIIINGDVYGYDDFARKVQQAQTGNTKSIRRMR